MGVKIVYLDMDGVLADFDGGILARGYPSEVITNEELFQQHIVKKEYDQQLFELLNPLPVYTYYNLFRRTYPSKNIEFKVLSYVGDHDKIRSVINQKRKWLTEHNMHDLEFIPVTENSEYKKFFANANTKLIDDSIKLVELFETFGGKALHIDKNDKTVHIKGYDQFFDFVLDY